MKKLQAVKLVLSISLLVAVYTAALPVPKILIPHSVSAASFTLYGSFSTGWGFTPTSITQPGPTLTVQPGESVSLTLFSADGRPHQFCVDYESTPDYVCQGSELATQSPMFTSSTTGTTFPFNAPTTPGTYTYFCTIHRSAMTGQFIVSAPPPDFSISSNPNSVTVQQGSSVISTVTLTSLNGFAGLVNLQTSTAPQGQTWSLNPSSVMLSSGGTANSALNVTASATAATGTYIASVTGTSGSLSHSTMITIQVVGPDFGISASQNSLTLQPGMSGTSTINLASQAGFAGTINLDANAGTGNGLSSSLNPVSVTLSSGSSASSTLTIKTTNSTNSGTYQVTIKGTSGSISHSITIRVTINGAPFQISFPIIVGGAIAIVAAVGIVGYVVLRARRPKS